MTRSVAVSDSWGIVAFGVASQLEICENNYRRSTTHPSIPWRRVSSGLADHFQYSATPSALTNWKIYNTLKTSPFHSAACIKGFTPLILAYRTRHIRASDSYYIRTNCFMFCHDVNASLREERFHWISSPLRAVGRCCAFLIEGYATSFSRGGP